MRRCVLLLAVLALVPAAGASAAYRAVIVGIDHYHHDWAAPLDSCVNDAKGFRAALLSDPVRWQPGNITLLLDEAATEDAIRDALAAMAAPPTASGDVCVYFHSSHGDQVSDTDTFVATYDAEFDDYELAVNLAAFPLDVSVINVIDACYAGGMFKDAGASRKWPFGRNVLDKLSVLRAASRVAKDIGDGNVAFVTACDYDETTASGSPYSQFSEQFIRGIGAAAADSNSDENWTFWEVFQYAKARADDAWQTAQYYEQSLLQGTVVAGGMGDFLTVVFPDGGETLRPGSSYWIAWVSNVGGTVALDLYDGGFWSATIASGTADTGGFEWAVPAGQAEGTGYTVLATAWSLSDESDAPFTVRPLLPDAYENDGSFAQAKPIAGGETQDHTIHVPGDEDYVVFVLAGASHVVIETAGASGDTILDLYDSSHIRITYNDDGGTGSFSRIETVLAAGTYYAIVFAYDVDAIIDAYALSLTVGAPLAPDAYEDDDTFAQAKSIAGGETQGRSIHVPGDVDYIRFTLAEDSDVVIETSGAAGDTVLELYDSSEGLVTSDDDGGVGLFSRIGRALTAGTYYAVVSSWDAEQTILAYALSLAAAPATPDAYENDGSFAQAQPIAGGETQDHTIHVPGDEDYVVFVLAGASHVVVETAGASGDTILDLYNSSYAWITYNDDGGTGSFSRIETVLAAGTYYAVVAAYDVHATIAAYALSLTVGAPLAPDAYEDDDTFAQAKSIAGGETQGRSIHVPGDVDYIRFTLAEDSDVVIETSGAAGDTVLELYDSSEGLVTSDDDGGVGTFSRIGRALTAGTYYAVVSSWDAEQTILAYALSLTTTPNTPSVEVVSPNGSESWQAGTSHVIQWNANQVGPYVRIELYVGGAPDSVIVSSTYDDGSFDWNIPQFQAARTDYRIRITSTYSAALWDESDAAFAITAAAPYIVVTSPNGGERWELGETESIVWRSNVGGYVRIELYSGGALDVEVAASTANDGRHSWIVPASHAEGNDYTLVVSSLDNPAVTDESDGTFSIVRYEPPTFNCSGAGVRRTGSVLAPALALALLAGLARLVRRRAGGRSGI